MRWGKLTEETRALEQKQREQQLSEFRRSQALLPVLVKEFDRDKQSRPYKYFFQRFAFLPTRLASGRWVWLETYWVERCASVEQGLRWFGDPVLGWSYNYIHYWEEKR